MISKDPLNSIKESRDPITGKKLVYYAKKSKRWKANSNIPKVRSGEEDRVENYYEAKKDDFKGWRLHHRLELTIDNKDALSMMDLINFGMYYHRPYFELIWLTEDEHNRLHACTRVGEKCNVYGRKGDRATAWKGDNIKPGTAYYRALRKFRRSEITEEQLQPYRDSWNQYRKERKR